MDTIVSSLGFERSLFLLDGNIVVKVKWMDGKSLVWTIEQLREAVLCKMERAYAKYIPWLEIFPVLAHKSFAQHTLTACFRRSMNRNPRLFVYPDA